MHTSLGVIVNNAAHLVGVDSGGTCDPYFIIQATNATGQDKVTFKSGKKKKDVNPVFYEMLTIPNVSRVQIQEGKYVGKPIIIDFFDHNTIQKHSFLGRATIELTADFFAANDSVNTTIHLRELKEGEEPIPNPKAKKHKAGETVGDHAKGKSKTDLKSHGIGECYVNLVLDDKNIGAEQLKHIQDTVALSSDKIKSMYAGFINAGKSPEFQITTVEKFIDVVNECKLFETILAKWNGNDPTANKNWDKLKDDKDFLNLLFKDLFQAFDVTGSGKVSFEEFCAGVFYILEGNKEDALRLRFRTIDTDRSGFIDLKEAKVLGGRTQTIIRVGMMIGLHQQKYELMRAGMSESDFMPLLDAIEKSFNQNSYADKEAKLMFKYADKNEDGQISEAEYIQFMTDVNAQAERQKEMDLILKPVLASITTNVQAAMIKIMMKVSK